jgi:hypothetical protein
MANTETIERKPLFRPFSDALLGALGGAVFSAILQFATLIFLADNGSIVVGPLVTLDNRLYQTLDVSNFTNDLLNGVILTVPKSTGIDRIYAQCL